MLNITTILNMIKQFALFIDISKIPGILNLIKAFQSLPADNSPETVRAKISGAIDIADAISKATPNTIDDGIMSLIDNVKSDPDLMNIIVSFFTKAPVTNPSASFEAGKIGNLLNLIQLIQSIMDMFKK